MQTDTEEKLFFFHVRNVSTFDFVTYTYIVTLLSRNHLIILAFLGNVYSAFSYLETCILNEVKKNSFNSFLTPFYVGCCTTM